MLCTPPGPQSFVPLFQSKGTACTGHDHKAVWHPLAGAGVLQLGLDAQPSICRTNQSLAKIVTIRSRKSTRRHKRFRPTGSDYCFLKALKKHSSEFGFAHSRYQKLRKGCTSKQDGATSGLYAGNSMLDGLLSLVPQIESHFRLEYMVKKDIYYIIEQPDSSILWDHPAMKVVASSPIRGTWVVAGFCF